MTIVINSLNAENLQEPLNSGVVKLYENNKIKYIIPDWMWLDYKLLEIENKYCNEENKLLEKEYDIILKDIERQKKINKIIIASTITIGGIGLSIGIGTLIYILVRR